MLSVPVMWRSGPRRGAVSRDWLALAPNATSSYEDRAELSVALCDRLPAASVSLLFRRIVFQHVFPLLIFLSLSSDSSEHQQQAERKGSVRVWLTVREITLSRARCATTCADTAASQQPDRSPSSRRHDKPTVLCGVF